MRTSPIALPTFLLFAALWLPASAAEYAPIDLSCCFNDRFTRDYRDPPVGDQTFEGVPFWIPPDGPNRWNANEPYRDGREMNIEIPVGLEGVLEIHTLINTHRGQAGLPSYANIEFIYGDDVGYEIDLIGDDDIRGWEPNPRWTDEINGTTTINVWEGTASHGAGPARVDKQTIALPPELSSQTLTSIRFNDTGSDAKQRMFLHGLTALAETPTNGGQLPKTHILAVGIKDGPDPIGMRGDLQAKWVAEAFSGSGTVKHLPMSSFAREDNKARLINAINAFPVEPGDQFVLYIGTHGAVMDYGTDGDELPVEAQNTNLLGRKWTEVETHDEALLLRRSNLGTQDKQTLTDDELSGLFQQRKWDGVSKLFLIDACMSGGFWGSDELGDTGDLNAPGIEKAALIAAADEGRFSYAGTYHDEEEGWVHVSVFSRALRDTLSALQERDRVIDLAELYESMESQDWTTYSDEAYRLSGFPEDWVDLWEVDFPAVPFEPTLKSTDDFSFFLRVPEPSTVATIASVLGLVIFKHGRSSARRKSHRPT